MVRAAYVPAKYYYFKNPDQEAFFSGQSSPVETKLCVATSANGWKTVRYDVGRQGSEDKEDIEDSLEALKEPRGISLEDLKRDLGA